MRLRGAAAALIAVTTACSHPPPPARPVVAPSPKASAWAAATLARLTLPEKVGQLIGVRAFGLYRNPRSAEFQKLLGQVRSLKVGCVVVFDSDVESVPRLLNQLQKAADVPLLVAADMERGLAFRVKRGVVPLPYAMALGATRSEEDARQTGVIAAREGRALGIHWAFAPVADVNNNPANPVINIRSYGEDPELVARLTAGFIRGAHDGGLLTTVKHFPGHGDTATDSHMHLATVDASRERLQSVELLPFRRAIAAGVDSVMLGHIAVPALDPTGAPATLSEPMTTALLRGDLGFQGLVVTDAMEMQGVRAAWTGEAAIRALQAGADFILLPPDPEVAVQAIVRAVGEGQLTEARIDASVRRVLEAKAALGLDRQRMVSTDIGGSVGRPEDIEASLDIARRSITLVRNEGAVLPLRPDEGPVQLLHLVMSSDIRNDAILGIPEDELALRGISARTVNLGPEVSDSTADRLIEEASQFTHVLVSAFVRVGAYRGTTDMSESHARLISRLHAAGHKVVVLSFGSPYLLRQFPQVPAYVCAYGPAESSQRAAVGALFAEYPVGGRLPVTLPGLYAYGHGLDLPRRPMTLRTTLPEDIGLRHDAFAGVDQIVSRAITQKAFPGAVVAVGRDGALVHLQAFGHLNYDAGAPAVQADTIYDMASLTKVIVTTTMAMILVDEGRLDIAKPVAAFLPGFRGGAKDKVTVEQLLTHSGGLDWWAPLYKELSGKKPYVQHIQTMDLAYEPGTKSLYSDLGLILLGEILERVSGQDLDAFARERIFGPLGMATTLYRPGPGLKLRIAPTENDPWRGHVLQGEVHDENAAALGGVAPHAGLFSTGPDLARFAQMLLNGGTLEHHRLVSRATLERFTRRAGVPGSSRALGWDTPSASSSAGTRLSERAFGHTGFTGTSVWIDPEQRLFVILLTNRVHPSRENNAIREVRREVADAVVAAMQPR